MRFLALIAALGGLLGCADEPKSGADDGGRANLAGGRDGGSGDGDGGLADPTACIEGAEEEHQPDAGAQHVSLFRDSELVYPDPPPTGGTHSECWADFGVYEQELEDARWVHNLEHGGIVLLYRCDPSCPEEVAQLAEFVASHPRTILSPYQALPTRFAVVAWEYRLLNNCLDLPAISQFYDAHFNHAREDIASGPPDVCR